MQEVHRRAAAGVNLSCTSPFKCNPSAIAMATYLELRAYIYTRVSILKPPLTYDDDTYGQSGSMTTMTTACRTISTLGRYC